MFLQFRFTWSFVGYLDRVSSQIWLLFNKKPLEAQYPFKYASLRYVISRVESGFETDRSDPGPESKDTFLWSWSQFIKSSIYKERRGKKIQGQY